MKRKREQKEPLAIPTIRTQRMKSVCGTKKEEDDEAADEFLVVVVARMMIAKTKRSRGKRRLELGGLLKEVHTKVESTKKSTDESS